MQQQITYIDSPINETKTYKSPKKATILFVKPVLGNTPQERKAYGICDTVEAYASVTNWSVHRHTLVT